MAIALGNSGSVVWTGDFDEQSGHITMWRGRFFNERIESSDFDDTDDSRHYYMGYQNCEVEVEGFLDSSNFIIETASLASGRAEGSAVFTSTTGVDVTATGHFENIEPVVSRQGGLNAFRANFIGRVTASST